MLSVAMRELRTLARHVPPAEPGMLQAAD
jgi:hypothetical protein